MKKNNINVYIFLVIVMVFITGCSNEFVQRNEDGTITARGNLNIWVNNQEVGDKLISEFTDKYPKVKVKTTYVAGNVIADDIQPYNENIPDVLIIPYSEYNKAVENGLLLPMSDNIVGNAEELVKRNYLSAVEEYGQYYGIPFTVKTPIVAYNKDIMYIKGIKVPSNFNQVIDIAQQYNNAEEGKYTFVWDTTSPKFNNMILETFGYNLFGDNNKDYSEYEVDSDEFLNALQYHRNLRKIYNVPADKSDYDTSLDLFLEGNALMALIDSEDIEKVDDNLVDFGLSTIPSIEAKPAKTIGEFNVIVIPSATKHKELAELFVETIVSDEVYTYIAANTDYIPLYSKILDLDIQDENKIALIQQSVYSEPQPRFEESIYAIDSLEKLLRLSWDTNEDFELETKKITRDYEQYLNENNKSLND